MRLKMGICGLCGLLATLFGHSAESIWLIEQDFVKFGKKEAYEAAKKNQQASLKKNMPLTQFCIEDEDSSQFIYLTPFKDFQDLSSLMKKRMDSHKKLDQSDLKQSLPFFSTVNFFFETVHRLIPEASFVAEDDEVFLSFSAVAYWVYGVTPGNGVLLEERLKALAASQRAKQNPIYFRTWRAVFGVDVPSYIVAVFGSSPRQAKKLGEEMQWIEGPIKKVIRQERQGVGIIRKDLSLIP